MENVLSLIAKLVASLARFGIWRGMYPLMHW
jgi:hypothetical protein